MGQRHQVYVRLPKKFYNDGNPNNREAVTIGLHHQWLYGMTAIKQLGRAYIYFAHAATDKYHTAHSSHPEEALDALASIYSMILEDGYYHRVHKFDIDDSVCRDPYLGDNNDGVTVIDLEDPENMKVGFLSVGHTEGEKSLPEGIYSAQQYIDSYYSKEDQDEAINDGFITQELFDQIIDLPVIDEADVMRIFPEFGASKRVVANG